MSVQNSLYPHYEPLVQSLREEYLSKGNFKKFPIHINHKKEVTLGEGHALSFKNLEHLFESLVSIFKGQEQGLYAFYQKLAHSLRGHLPYEMEQKIQTSAIKGHLHALIEKNLKWMHELEDLDKNFLDYEVLKTTLEKEKSPFDFEFALANQKKLSQKLLLHLIRLSASPNHIAELTDILLESSDFELGVLAADEGGNTALHYAALSGDFKTLKKIKKELGDFSKVINLPNREGLTPLHYALKFKQFEFAKKLLAKGGDINVEVPFGKWTSMTPLLFAVCDDDVEALEFCLSQTGVDVYATDAEERNILHLAKKHQSQKVWEILKSRQEFETLLEKTDIYGKTALGLDPNEIDISQEKIREQFKLYLKIKGRDSSVLGEGSCNGLSFLIFYYENCGQLNEFYKALMAFAAWNGSEEALKKKVSFLDEYEDLEDLFEAWIQDIGWFQHLTSDFEENITSWNQADRLKMLEVVKKNKETHLDLLFPDTNYVLTKEQLTEILDLFLTQPNTVLEFGEAGHRISAKALFDGTYRYYDSNLPHRTKIFRSTKELARLIYNIKYRKFASQPIEKMTISITAYSYAGVPQGTKGALKEKFFGRTSPNGFTPLHLALLARDNAVFLKSLKKEDPNTPDVHGRTPLNYAILLGENHFVRWLIQDKRVDVNASSPLQMAIVQENDEAFEMLLQHPDIQLKGALYYAVKANQPKYVKQILKIFPDIDPNDEPNDMIMAVGALEEALRQKNLPLVELLLAHKGDLFKENSEGRVIFETVAENYQEEELLKCVLKYVGSEKRSEVIRLAETYANETLISLMKQMYPEASGSNH